MAGTLELSKGFISANKDELSGHVHYFLLDQTESQALFTILDDSGDCFSKTDFQRFLVPSDTNLTGNCIFSSQLYTGIYHGIISIKDTILLKLRI
ncbi:MAG: hypothetical protein FWH35_07390 [Treponema sp.]|nr:hypothetical protein [Treponema sp.]